MSFGRRCPSLRHAFVLTTSLFVATSALPACGDDDEADTTSSSSSTGSGGAAGGATTASTTSASTTASGGTTSTGQGGQGGQGGNGGGGGSGGEGGAGASGGGGSGGAPECPEQPAPFTLSDIDAPCEEIAALPEPPEFHVEWLDVPDGEVSTFTSEIGADYAWPFVLSLPTADIGDFELIHTRCFELAGEPEFCTEGPVEGIEVEAACSERLSPRFGLDPSSYNVGENHYRVGFTLRRGCAEVSTEFGFTVIYDPQ